MFGNVDFYKWVVIPLLIFFARVSDQSIGTLRIIFVSKGQKRIVSILGFFESLIWILVISQVIQNLDNIFCYIAYAAGFATGNFVGIIIEEKLAMGQCLLRVITRKDSVPLQKTLKKKGYGFVNLVGDDIDGHESVLFILTRRKELSKVIEIIEDFNPNAFFTIEDVRAVHEGRYPLKETKPSNSYFNILSFFRIKEMAKRMIIRK